MRIAISGGGTGGGVYPGLAAAAALKALASTPSSDPHPGRDLTPGPSASPPAPLHQVERGVGQELFQGEGNRTGDHSGERGTQQGIIPGRGESQGGVDLLWIGGTKGPERDLAAREGIPFRTVSSGQIAGAGVRALLAPALIGWGLLQALAILARFGPQALLITGGWVTIPPALACWLLRIPVMIYAPDVEPGGTISVLRRIAAKVAINAPDSARFYRPEQVIEIGYPLRAELLAAAGFDLLGQPTGKAVDKRKARQAFGAGGKLPILLVFGGSTGARSINRAVTDHLGAILDAWEVIHVTGRLDAGWVRKAAAKLPAELAPRYHLHEYLHSGEMALALAAADAAVSRAGASTLGEFPLFGLPAILVPYPHAWRYQKTNAERLASQGAALRLDDDKLGEGLLPALAQVAAARGEMARASSTLRRPDAAARLASALAQLAQRA